MNTFYHGDCKFVMEHDIEPESIDLIYLDPPFFTGKVQKGIAKWKPREMPITYEDGKRFWKEKGIASNAADWLKHIAIDRPDFAAYLFYMMERLEACHKVLKPTGSIYLHCDWRSSHYLKMIMDEPKLFGVENFRNEIIWSYHWGIHTNKQWNRKHDSIIFYSKSSKWLFNADPVREPYSKGSIMTQDPRWNKSYNPNGRLPEDVWDIPTINGMAKERVGYPTQKPLALLERIIKASSNEGDIILDPFCGCGTAIIAAHNLRRYWTGIDISRDAYEVTIERMAKAAQHRQGMDDTFSYITRDINEINGLNPKEFEDWANEFFKADKPSPDKGVDGITKDGIPIQTKTSKVKYDILSTFFADIQYHPALKGNLITKAIIVSQVGFDNSAYQRQYEIKARDNIQIDLLTPSKMLSDYKGD